MTHETNASGPCSCAVALEGEIGHAYNEAGFRYFLEIERRRAELTNRPLLLVLVAVTPESGPDETMPPDVARTLFSTLASCFRETDFVGWYREGRIAGAVLMQVADVSRSQVAAEVSARINGALGAAFTASSTGRVRVQVFQVAPSDAGSPRSCE